METHTHTHTHTRHTSLHMSAATDRHPGIWEAITGMLRRKKQRRYSIEEGIYLDDINDEGMDPEKLSQFFPPV